MSGRLRVTGGDRGAAAIEFALVSMLLTLFLLGMLQFGLILFDWQQIVRSAQEGARWAALGEDASTVDSRVDAAAAPLVPKRVEISPEDYASRPGDPVTVTVYYDVAVIAPLMEDILRASGVKEIRASATQMVE